MDVILELSKCNLYSYIHVGGTPLSSRKWGLFAAASLLQCKFHLGSLMGD